MLMYKYRVLRAGDDSLIIDGVEHPLDTVVEMSEDAAIPYVDAGKLELIPEEEPVEVADEVAETPDEDAGDEEEVDEDDDSDADEDAVENGSEAGTETTDTGDEAPSTDVETEEVPSGEGDTTAPAAE